VLRRPSALLEPCRGPLERRLDGVRDKYMQVGGARVDLRRLERTATTTKKKKKKSTNVSSIVYKLFVTESLYDQNTLFH
jgi:hypothetical protein